MAFAENSGIRIRFEIEGDGPPLVMLHGRGNCIDDWYDCGYIEPLSATHRLILIDARGHGQSDKPHEPAAYDTIEHSRDVVAVMDELGIQAATVFGYSQGARTTLRLAVEFPERVSRFIAGGGRVSPQDTTPIHEVWCRGKEAFMAYVEPAYGEWLTPARRARMQEIDMDAFVAMVEPSCNEEPILPRLSAVAAPCLLYAGTDDAIEPDVRACAEALPNSTYFIIPDLGHIEALMRGDLVLPPITKFLNS